MLVLGLATRAAQAQVAWTPSNTTVAAWYDAADAGTVLISGTAVTNWLDKSGNGYHSSQASSNPRPQYQSSVLNGLPVVMFDGTDDVLPITGTFSMQNVFIVLNANDGATFTNWRWPFGGWTASNNKFVAAYANPTTTQLYSGGTAYLNGTTAGSAYVNFDPLSSYKIFGSMLTATSGARADWKIGNGDAFWKGGIAEIVVTSGTITTGDRQKVEGYLAWKWGLQANLPANHPYKSEQPLLRLSVTVTAPSDGQVFLGGASVTATVGVEYGATNYQTVAFYTNGVSAWSTNNTSSKLFAIPLGVLEAGTYTNYAYVLDATNGMAYSSTNTFSVTPPPQTYYWDTDGSTGGFGDTAGTWGTSAFWSTDSTGASVPANPTVTTVDGIHFGTATLALGSAAATVGVSGAVNANSITFGAAQTTPVTLSGGTSITLGGMSPTITVNNASNTISSVLAGSSFTKAGNGTLTLSGNNTHTGTTTIVAGTLRLQGANMWTTARTYTINNGAVLNLAGGVDFKVLTALSTTTINGTGTLRLNGWYGATSATTGKIAISLASGGLIDIQSGATLQNGGWSYITWTGNSGGLSVDGTLDCADGNDVTVGALTGNGLITKGWGGNKTLTVGAANGSGTFSGIITNPPGQVVALTKTGTGTQTLSGNNSYSGVTSIGNGILAIAHNNALGNTTGNTTITATGSNSGPRLTLSGNITSPENFSINGNTEQTNWASAIYNTSGTNTLSGTITLNNPVGNIRLTSGVGELILAGTITQATSSKNLIFQAAPGAALTVNNAIANNNGVLSILGWATSGASAGVTLKASSTAIGNVFIGENGLLKLGVTDALKTTATLTLGQTGSNTGFDTGTFDLAGFNQTVAVLVGSKNTSGTIAPDTRRVVTNSAASGTSTLTVNGSSTSTFNGVILDGATAKVALTKTGTGTLILAGSCTYSGDTIVTNGILRITGNTVLSPLTRVYLSTGSQTGTIDLAFGGTQMIKALYINGVKQPMGATFGANGTTITGTGVLRTAAGGTLIRFF